METEKRKKTIWDYYTRNGKDKAKCNNCKKILKAGGGSTSGLHAHLKSQHQVNLLKRAETDVSTPISSAHQEDKSSEASSSRNTLAYYFKRTIDDSLSAVISRMVAKDGFPFQKFCSSFDLRRLLKAKGYTVPKSANSIKNLVMEYGVKIRSEIRGNISDQIKNGARFSLTFDEWTSIKNRRYMNINVHTAGNKFWNLGLTRAHGSMNANKCRNLVETKLEEFGLNFNGIVSITTDGAAVMKKLGLSLNTDHQLCLAHGIQLAVIKVLYKKNIVEPVSVSGESSEEDGEEEEGEEDYLPEAFSLEFHLVDESDVSNETILPIITKIRRVVKLFRRSPTKNDVLQQHVKNEFGKEICFILDSRSRWNSLLDMVERFYQLKSCARKSLIDLNIDISFSENEIDFINSVISTLLPVKLAVEALGASDCTLLNADVAIKFMLDELSAQSSTLSRELKYELILRVQERRTSYSNVIQFLHNPLEFRNIHLEDNYNLFKLNKPEITKMTVSLIERLNVINDSEWNNESNESSDDAASEVLEPTPLSMKDRLQLAIKQKNELKLNEITRAPITKNTATLTKLVKKEIAVLEEEKSRGKYLTLAFNYLSSIKPTSVESERAFSSAGVICTKIRSRLSDTTIDTICLLRAYFNAQKDLLMDI